MPACESRLATLERALESMGRVAVAFSGGVDSAFLLAASVRALGEKVTAVTVRAQMFPAEEIDFAIEFCKRRSVRHVTIDIDAMEIARFRQNPPDRCYHCKKALFAKIIRTAEELGLGKVLEGSNVDDLGEWRPGRKALEELGVARPLEEGGWTKEEIRECSRRLGLETAGKQSLACLATRIETGVEITAEELKKIEKAEKFIKGILPDIGQLRVRSHGRVGRIEVGRHKRGEILEKGEEICAGLKEAGFGFAALDIEGYRTGSMNGRN